MLPVALQKYVHGCVCAVAMSVPALMSGGRTRFLGAKALTFQEEQRKQRWPGGYREGPRARLADPSLSDPPSCQMDFQGGRLWAHDWRQVGGRSPGAPQDLRAEPGLLSTEVGGLVQPEITRARPPSGDTVSGASCSSPCCGGPFT